MRKGTTASTSKLAKLRAERGLGLRELAELSGVGIRQIQGIEGGTSKVENTSLKNALAIADALGVQPRPASGRAGIFIYWRLALWERIINI